MGFFSKKTLFFEFTKLRRKIELATFFLFLYLFITFGSFVGAFRTPTLYTVKSAKNVTPRPLFFMLF